jgi:hypothetical protein
MFPNAGLLQQLIDSKVADMRRDRSTTRIDAVRRHAPRRTVRPLLRRRSH